MIFVFPIIYHLIPNRSLPLKLFNTLKLLLLAILPWSSLSSGRLSPARTAAPLPPPRKRERGSSGKRGREASGSTVLTVGPIEN